MDTNRQLTLNPKRVERREGVFNLDVPVVMGTVMVSAVIVLAANLVVDVLYRWIDPRITSG